MSYDRFVFWQDKQPTLEQLQTALEDYLGGIGNIEKKPTRSRSMQGWWIVDLPGIPTNPFKRIANLNDPSPMDAAGKPCRWFEVYIDNNSIDVLTRPYADEFTINIAKGYAELCARYWQGKLQE